ncbi:peptidase of plants and bacteria-domain-containing protein [Suillus spraguei]|nr:peptidase of plants and bacteria-domain-containing protein [Suillus spraguei]
MPRASDNRDESHSMKGRLARISQSVKKTTNSDLAPSFAPSCSLLVTAIPMPPHDFSPPSTWKIPNFMLRVEDSRPGASIFFECVKPKEVFKLAVEASYTWLYTPLMAPTHITLVLRSFHGVAYTFGTHETKEINFSLDWIKSLEACSQDEILGVLVHEVVHCYQYNAKNTCPGGLIEDIAGAHVFDIIR